MPEKPKVEQWLLDAAKHICGDSKIYVNGGLEMTGWPHSTKGWVNAEELAEIIRSHAPTPAPEPTAEKMRKALEFASEILHDQAERFHKDCRCQLCESCIQMVDEALAAPAAAQGAPDGKHEDSCPLCGGLDKHESDCMNRGIVLHSKYCRALYRNARLGQSLETSHATCTCVCHRRFENAALPSSPVSRKED